MELFNLKKVNSCLIKWKEAEYLKIYNEYDSMKIATGHSIGELIESYDNDLSGMIVNDYIEKRIREEITDMEKSYCCLKIS